MAKDKKRPDWLEKLKKLMKDPDGSDKKKLKKTLAELKQKSNDLKDQIDQEKDAGHRAELKEKWELVNKHRKKGIRRLEELNKKD